MMLILLKEMNQYLHFNFFNKRVTKWFFEIKFVLNHNVCIIERMDQILQYDLFNKRATKYFFGIKFGLNHDVHIFERKGLISAIFYLQ